MEEEEVLYIGIITQLLITVCDNSVDIVVTILTSETEIYLS